MIFLIGLVIRQAVLNLKNPKWEEWKLVMLHRLLNWLQQFRREESGQGLVEYVLVIALVALAATAGMNTLATQVNSAFTQVGAVLGLYVT